MNSKSYSKLSILVFSLLIIILLSISISIVFAEPGCGSCGGGGEPCFLPNVLIKLSDGSYTKISEIKVGDSVVGFDSNGNLVANTVEAVIRSQSDNYFILKTTSQEVKVTGAHPFYVGDGKYKKVVDLNPGDTVYVLVDGKLVKDKILSKERIDEKVDVYNLQVTGTNNYFANSFAVHNKGGLETTTTTIVHFCGDGTVNTGEQCELPNTINNTHCSQTTSTCSGNQTGTRDSLGNCNSACQCLKDPFTYSCVKNSCGAECAVNSDCQNKCVGSVRYYNGNCGSTSCSCTYTTQDCNSLDGWYNTTQTQWVDIDSCRQKQQLNQTYRDYSCSPDGCTFVITNWQWIDTGNVRNKPDGTVCGSNSTNNCPTDYCLGLVFYNSTFNPCNQLCSGGLCGTCNSCSLTTQVCSPVGCCDATCNSVNGCGLVQNNNNCQNYCSGPVRYFSGSCGSGCGCNYQTENCNYFDGWYNTTEKQWIDVNFCTKKEQLKQEYRDYSCAPGGCTYIITKYQWIDTGVYNYLPPTTSCGTNITSCPGNKCSGLTFFDWSYSPCTRYCDGSGNCGTCSTCDLTSLLCTASGCCDATCNPFTGCGSVKNNNNCQPYCIGNTRYFSGVCGNYCSCSYTTQNCDSSSGWYNTTQKQWVKCPDNPCKLCEQVKQQFKQFFCQPSGCTFTVTDERFIDTGRTKNTQCCKGNVILTTLNDPCPGTNLRAVISGVNGCSGKIAYLKEDSCDGKTIGFCTVGISSCLATFKISEVGDHTLVACLDKNGNGNFGDLGDQASKIIDVTCNACRTQTYCNSLSQCGGWCLTCNGKLSNPFKQSICLNTWQTCSYSCQIGYCSAGIC